MPQTSSFRAAVRWMIAGFLLPASGADAQAPQLDASRLTAAPVRYSAGTTFRSFPVPVLHWRRAGLMKSPQEMDEIKNKVIYPFLLAGGKPVTAIVVEFLPVDERQLGVLVIWTDGDTRESAIARAPDGTYAPDAYRTLLARPTP